MKLQIVFVLTFLILQPMHNTFGQPTGSEEFEKIHELIKPSLIEGYIWKADESWDNRSRYTYTYDLNESELNRLIYAFYPNAKEFSMMAAAMGGVEFDWQGRKAMYIDGKETGMSSISVLLSNGKGRFELSHRELGNVSPFSKPEMEQILSKIQLENLEN